MSRNIKPSYRSNTFKCSHCNANTGQSWYRTVLDRLGETPKSSFDRMAHDIKKWSQASATLNPDFAYIMINSRSKKDDSTGLISDKSPPFIFPLSHRNEVSIDGVVFNVWVAECHICAGLSIWCGSECIYPLTAEGVSPNEDLPEGIKQIFIEASLVVRHSPRAAAALLRSAIEMICNDLKEKGIFDFKNATSLNDRIGMLAKEKLGQAALQAFDIVRITGNDAVHAGVIHHEEVRETPEILFELVNLIADECFTKPKNVANIYNKLPKSARDAIARRDRPKDER